MTKFDKIPAEVFKEAEKFGVLEKDILFAAHADKDRNGVFCDNWVLITEEEIVMIGGIQLVVPKGRKNDIDEFAKAQGESVNGLMNTLLREAMGMSEEEWKTVTDETGEA